MKTTLIYLDRPDLFSCQAKILRIDNDEKGTYAVFDKTVFYPQGGGQESDQGIVEFDLDSNRTIKKEIKRVLLVNGVAHHYGNFGDLVDLEKVKRAKLSIDIPLRNHNSKLHSAGHLIASIVEEMDSGLRAIKGFHFREGSYIGFTILDQKQRDLEKIKEDLNKKVIEDIEKDLKITTEQTTLEELKRICKYVPSYLPKDKPLRVVTIENYFPIPCGGTHVKSLSTFESISILKVRNRKGEIKISYTIT